MKKLDKLLVIGIGNNGRQDDGLGWMFLDFLEELGVEVELEYRYQMQIEDAELISNYKHVIFVDATKESTEDGYYLKSCQSSEKYSFSTHELAPETILYLSETMYNHHPKAFIFGIQGYHWELEIGLSKQGEINLEKAKKHFEEHVLPAYLSMHKTE